MIRRLRELKYAMKESVSTFINSLYLPEAAKAANGLGRSIRMTSSMSTVSMPYPSPYDGNDLGILKLADIFRVDGMRESH